MSPGSYYTGKVAVVTGAASGIGLALATAMLSFGAARLILADRDEESLAHAVDRLLAIYPGRVIGMPADVTVEDDVRRIIESAVEAAGRVDFLFNNAGAGLGGLFEAQTNREWERAYAVNFYGPLYGIRAVLPVMRRQGDGHIVNIISGIAFAPMAQQTMYAATKAALNGLSLALRYELWDDGIRVTSATPGTTATGIWAAGGKRAPADAQSAEQAAQAILAGVARNERLVLGDRNDVEGAINAFNPAAATAMDAYLLDVARRRRRGEVAV